MMQTLDELAVKYSTDKSSRGHGYTAGQIWTFGMDNTDDDGIILWDDTNSVKFLKFTPNSTTLLHPDAHANITVFQNAAEGETQELVIYGYRAADANRQLQIGVGIDAADTASFDGVSNYYFDGSLGEGTHSANSFHLWGRAWDMREGQRVTEAEMRRVLGSDFDFVPHNGHWHIEYDPK